VRSLVWKAGWWMRGYGRTSATCVKRRQKDPRGSRIFRETHDGVIVTNSNDQGAAVWMSSDSVGL
jgi:hypothetical protein